MNCQTLHLGKWLVTVIDDGSLLLQHSEVYSTGGAQGEIQEEGNPVLTAQELLVRTVLLCSDGAVYCDPGAISFQGVLSSDAFEILAPTAQAVAGKMPKPQY